MMLTVVEEGTEDGCMGQEVGVADDDFFFACPGERHIETTVDERTCEGVGEGGGGEELQLVLIPRRETIDNDVALRALIAFDSIYR